MDAFGAGLLAFLASADNGWCDCLWALGCLLKKSLHLSLLVYLSRGLVKSVVVVGVMA